MIADQVRIRRDLRPISAASELDLKVRMPVMSRRGDLVEDQTRRLSRTHDLLLCSIHPGLERALDLATKGALWFLTRYATPAEILRAGRNRLVAHLGRAGRLKGSVVEALADAAPASAKARRLAVPGERVAAGLLRELAAEALAVRERLARLDRDLEALLERHPDAAIVRSLPGMGTVLTAEFIAEACEVSRFRSADALTSAAGLAPVLRQSGKSRTLRRPNGGNKALKRIFYQSAFCSLHSPPAAPSTPASARRASATTRPSSRRSPSAASACSGRCSGTGGRSRPSFVPSRLDKRIRPPLRRPRRTGGAWGP